MKSRLSLISIFSLFMFFLFISSCQKDELSDSTNIQLSNRSTPAFTYSVNPANVGDSVTVTFDADNGADCGHIQIQISGPNGQGWMNGGGKPIEPDSGIATLLFVPDAPGEYLVRAKYTRTGNPKNCDFESTGWVDAEELLIVAGDSMDMDTTGMDDDSTGMDDDSTDCEASFTGEVITCDSTSREVVFTYTPDDNYNHAKIKGGLTNFTEDDAVVTVEGADLDVTQKTPGNSSNRVITLTGSVEACVTITITITWTSTNDDPFITGEWSASGGLDVGPLECE